MTVLGKPDTMIPVKLDCRECSSVYEFPASPEEVSRLTASCPECGGTDVQRGFPVLGGATGTYRYVLTLGRTAKVSDRIPSVRSGAGPRTGGVGPAGGSSSCCGGGCGCR